MSVVVAGPALRQRSEAWEKASPCMCSAVPSTARAAELSSGTPAAAAGVPLAGSPPCPDLWRSPEFSRKAGASWGRLIEASHCSTWSPSHFWDGVDWNPIFQAT